MPSPTARLTVVAGKEVGTAYELRDGIYSIGRAPDNSLVLVDLGVSRCHALLIFQAGQCRLEDLGSTNGTFRNEFRVASCPIKEGDRIAIGDTEFQFERERRTGLRGLLASRRRGGVRQRGRLRRPKPLSEGMLHAFGAGTVALKTPADRALAAAEAKRG